ncbi:hypothetical protein HA520_02600 [Azotobacter chroococcum]|uniref:Chloramphenicol acetyltransferase n=1 Tax=Azotobacter chroococcum TaxID=353 RepID=A0AA43Z3Q2_9GAMM|nr:CatA-like O-acetyltransferase [Azotobacter chroococcum]NHN76181.1 hypothetical protein [Azotobacter chroococcum]
MVAKRVDLDGYSRRATFEAFSNHEVPVLSVTCEIDISPLLAFHEMHGLRFFPLIAYLIDKAINQVDEMRHRIVDGELYEYDVVSPSFTVLLADKTISFCDAVHCSDARAFYWQVIERSEEVQRKSDLEMREKHGQYFVSNIPWLRFSSFTHPYFSKYASIPIVTIGKYERLGAKATLPVALQAHHGLVDGYHLGRFYESLAETVRNAHDELRPIVA